MSRAEWSRFADPRTGVEVTQLTNYRGHSHHFYFTNPGWYDGGRKLLFASDRSNRTNLFGVDLSSGDIEQLTDLEPVPLPQELEFVRSFKNPVRDEVYFMHDRTLMMLDISTRKLTELLVTDARWCVSMLSCGADGRHVYFGVWEDLSDKFNIDLLRGYVGFTETWEARPLSRIERVEIATKKHEILFEEKYWIGHINLSPTNPNLMTYCHEGPWNRVDQRIWGLEISSGKTWKIRPCGPHETVGHEYWFADGKRIGYHGHKHGESAGAIFGSINCDGSGAIETAALGETGHIFSLDEKVIFGDGQGVIRYWRRENEKYLPPQMICTHNSGMRIQQTHPHPVISPDGSQLVYSSDGRTGYGNVYLVALDQLDLTKLPVIENA